MGAPPPALRAEPKPPEPDKHKPFHYLSWDFYLTRQKLLGDEYFNPWEGKHLRNCKLIIEQKARGDVAEARRRARNLVAYFRLEPGFWSVDPGKLLSQWEKLALPPVLNGGRVALKRAQADQERNARREQLAREARYERTGVAEAGSGQGNLSPSPPLALRKTRDA